MKNTYDLITSGCSFTKNGYLTEKSFQKETDLNNYFWSEWYAHLTNKSFVNLGNQTNDNISISRIINYYIDKLNPSEVIIQWSAETRYSFFIQNFMSEYAHTLNYTFEKNSSFYLTGGFRFENDIEATQQISGLFDLQKNFSLLTEQPIHQVLHWFEVWSLLIKKMDERKIKRKYFSMVKIDFSKYLNHPLLLPYRDLIQNELKYYKYIKSGALEYSIGFYNDREPLKEHIEGNMELNIFHEEIHTPDWIEKQLSNGSEVNNLWGHPSSVVYKKFVKDHLLNERIF